MAHNEARVSGPSEIILDESEIEKHSTELVHALIELKGQQEMVKHDFRLHIEVIERKTYLRA